MKKHKKTTQPLGYAIYNLPKKRFYSVLTKSNWTTSLKRATIQTKGESKKIIREMKNPFVFLSPIVAKTDSTKLINA